MCLAWTIFIDQVNMDNQLPKVLIQPVLPDVEKDNEDSSSSELDLKALLLKSMPISGQHAYALKVTHTSDDYCHMLSYFVQY
jgi:hypothetical protein